MPRDKKEGAASGGDGKPFNEKVDEIVGKAIPQKWLGTAFAGAAILTLLFFILMIVGFMSGEKTQAQVDDDQKRIIERLETRLERVKGALEKEQETHGETKTALREATGELKQAKRTASSAEGTVASAEKRRDKVQAAFDDQKKDLVNLKKRLDAATRDKRTAEQKLSRAVSERDRAKSTGGDIAKRLAAKETGLKELRAKYDALSRQRVDDSKRLKAARDAYDSIIARSLAEEDLAERLVLVKKLRDESLSKLGAYTPKVESEIARIEQLIVRSEALAKKKTTRKASEAYGDAMRALKMTKDYARSMDILRSAKDEVAGTKYEVSIHQQLESREKTEKTRLARIVYDAAMKQLKVEPKAFEENLRALETAFGQTEGTAYAAKLKKQVDARTKSLATDLARGAYESLNAQIRKRPPDYDANIMAAEDALVTAKDTRYEAKIRGILTSQQTMRLRAIGLEAYNACIKQVRGSKDYEANVAELESQKEKAAGSVYEAKIVKLLAGQNKYLARERARNR